MIKQLWEQDNNSKKAQIGKYTNWGYAKYKIRINFPYTFKANKRY